MKIRLKGGPRTVEELFVEYKEFRDWVAVDAYRALRARFTVDELRNLKGSERVTVTVRTLRVEGRDPSQVVETVMRLLAAEEERRGLEVSRSARIETTVPPAFEGVDFFPSDVDPAHVRAIIEEYIRPKSGLAFVNGRPINDRTVRSRVQGELGRAYRPDAFTRALDWLASLPIGLLEQVGTGRSSGERGRTLILNPERVGPYGKKLLELLRK